MAENTPPLVKYPTAEDAVFSKQMPNESIRTPMDNKMQGPQRPVTVVTTPSKPHPQEASTYLDEQEEHYNPGPRNSPTGYRLRPTASVASWERDSLFAHNSSATGLPTLPFSPPPPDRNTRWPGSEAVTPEGPVASGSFEVPQLTPLSEYGFEETSATLFPLPFYKSRSPTEYPGNGSGNVGLSPAAGGHYHPTLPPSIPSDTHTPVTAFLVSSFPTKGNLQKYLPKPRLSPKNPEKKHAKSPRRGYTALQRIAGLYHRAGEIYDAGPPGDAQKVWRDIQRLRKTQQAKKQTSKQREKFSEQVASPGHSKSKVPSPTADIGTNQPMLGFPYNLSSPGKVSPLLPLVIKDGAGTSNKNRKTQGTKGPLVSPASFEAPLAASASVHYDAVSPLEPSSKKQYVDIDKPLPPPPQISAAPTSRKKSPSPPPPALRLNQKIPPKGKTPASIFLAQQENRDKKFATLQDLQGLKPNRKEYERRQGEKPKATMPHPARLVVTLDSQKQKLRTHLPVKEHKEPKVKADKSALRRQEKLKAKISAPLPMMSPVHFTANIGVENGGVGGVGAAISLPLKNGVGVPQSTTKAVSEKEKQSAPPRPERPSVVEAKDNKFPSHQQQQHHHGFTDRLSPGKLFRSHGDKPKKRRGSVDSDMSFGCQGISDDSAYLFPPKTALFAPVYATPPAAIAPSHDHGHCYDQQQNQGEVQAESPSSTYESHPPNPPPRPPPPPPHTTPSRKVQQPATRAKFTFAEAAPDPEPGEPIRPDRPSRPE